MSNEPNKLKKNFLDSNNKKYYIILLMFMFLLTPIQVVDAGIGVSEASGIPKIIETKVTNPINENDNQILEVWVKNTGTSDNVGVTLYSERGGMIDSKSQIINSGDIGNYKFLLPVSGVSNDTNIRIKTEAKAWNGEDYVYVEYTVKDIAPTPTLKTSPSFGVILSLITIFVIVLFKRF